MNENCCYEQTNPNKSLQETLDLDLDHTKIIQKHFNNMEKSFNNSMNSDIDIVIDYRVIKGHKFVLSHNPSFRKMFIETPDLKEILLSDQISDSVESDIKFLFCSDLDQEEKENILKFSSEACVTFLQYLYSIEIKREKVTLDLMLVAHEFTDDILLEFCENYLLNDVNMRNAIRTLLVALKTDCEKLKKVASLLIAKNFCEMKFNTLFQLVLDDENALSAILQVFDECRMTLLPDLEDNEENSKTKTNLLRNADLVLKVENHHFLTHKNILSEKNAVFKEIINAASIDGFPTSVNIPDVDQKTFRIFLDYLYTSNLKTCEISKELLELAYKYTDDRLKAKCEQNFILNLNNENVIKSFIAATEFKCETLKMRTSNYIVMKHDLLKNHPDYPILMKNHEAAAAIVETCCERIATKNPSSHFFGKLVFDAPVDSTYEYSKEFHVGEKRFKLMVYFRNDNLSVYLDLVHPNSSLRASYLFKLVSKINEEHSISKLLYKKFDKDFRSFGWPNFVSSSVLQNPEFGFIKDGKITLEVDVTVV